MKLSLYLKPHCKHIVNMFISYVLFQFMKFLKRKTAAKSTRFTGNTHHISHMIIHNDTNKGGGGMLYGKTWSSFILKNILEKMFVWHHKSLLKYEASSAALGPVGRRLVEITVLFVLLCIGVENLKQFDLWSRIGHSPEIQTKKS